MGINGIFRAWDHQPLQVDMVCHTNQNVKISCRLRYCKNGSYKNEFSGKIKMRVMKAQL
jgi:hypothetical protein